MPDLTKYQYWNGEGKGWVPMDPSAATPIFPGPVGEMSAQYNNYLKQYLVLYTNGGSNDVVARTAPLRKDHGVRNNRWCRRSRCPVASTRR